MNELNPSNRNLLIAIAVTLGIWGCAQNPGPSPKAQAEKIKTPKSPMSQIKILPHKEKDEWELVAKYNIGRKKI